MRGTVEGSMYPTFLQGVEIEIEPIDDEWGRCASYGGVWIRLDDVQEVEDWEAEEDAHDSPSLMYWGGISTGSISASVISPSRNLADEIDALQTKVDVMMAIIDEMEEKNR